MMEVTSMISTARKAKCQVNIPLLLSFLYVTFHVANFIHHFILRYWCDGRGHIGPLARASYDLHKIYGSEFDCDYRAVDSLEVYVDKSQSLRL